MKRLRALYDAFKREIAVWRRVLSDPRTPRTAKWLLGLAAAYLVTPFDIIPDFIPFLGQLDDLVIIPLLIYFAVRLTPPQIVAEARAAVSSSASPTLPPAS